MTLTQNSKPGYLPARATFCGGVAESPRILAVAGRRKRAREVRAESVAEAALGAPCADCVIVEDFAPRWTRARVCGTDHDGVLRRVSGLGARADERRPERAR